MIKLSITAIALMLMLVSARYAWDTQVAGDPQCSDARPSIFLRSETLAKIAMQCVGDIDVDAARHYASASLRRQGHNLLAMAVMGSIADLKPDTAHADAWMRAAASLGRRDYTVDSYWATRSLQGGNLMQAARAIDALFRSGWTSDIVTDQARALEASAQGREALLSIMNGTSPWAKSYLMDVRSLSDGQLTNRRTLLLEAARLANTNRSLEPLATDIILPAVSELHKRQALAAAYDLRKSYKPFAVSSIVNDGSFTATDLSLHSPFDWTFYHASGLDVSTAADGDGGHALTLRGDGSGRFRIASQTLKLAPGGYRVTISGATHTYASASSSLVVMLTRTTGPEGPSPMVALPLPSTAKPSAGQFNIDDNALFYRLDLALDAANAENGVDLQIDSINVERIR